MFIVIFVLIKNVTILVVEYRQFAVNLIILWYRVIISFHHYYYCN